MSEDGISATGERIISEQMDKSYIQIHPLLKTFYFMPNFWKKMPLVIIEYFLAHSLKFYKLKKKLR